MSAGIWAHARDDLQHLLEGVISVMQAGVLSGMGFLAVLLLLFMYLALIGLAVALAMRNALHLRDRGGGARWCSRRRCCRCSGTRPARSCTSPYRWSSRSSAIVITLTLAVKVMANATNLTPTGDQLKDGVSALGVLFAGVVCFAVASITPLVLYKLMPTVEGAMVGAGVAGGWGRGAMTGMYGVSTMKNLGGSLGRLGSKPVPARVRRQHCRVGESN